MSGFRAAEPFGAAAAFVGEVGDKFGADFAASWLSPKTCRFGEREVFTLGFAADRINVQCAGLIAKHGVVVKSCPHVTRDVYAQQQRQCEREAPPPAKRRAR